jgi:hypothetical protein
MDTDLKAQLDRIEAVANAAARSAERTRKYILWTGIITAVIIVAPLLLLPFAIGSLISSYGSALNF